jgi:hypothetical protein
VNRTIVFLAVLFAVGGVVSWHGAVVQDLNDASAAIHDPDLRAFSIDPVTDEVTLVREDTNVPGVPDSTAEDTLKWKIEGHLNAKARQHRDLYAVLVPYRASVASIPTESRG